MTHSFSLLFPLSVLCGQVSQLCGRDSNSNKINLTVGAYRDEKGKSVVLESVREAERIIFENEMDHGTLSLTLIPSLPPSYPLTPTPPHRVPSFGRTP